MIDLALDFWRTDGDQWVDQPAEERELAFRERGYQVMLEQMRATCHEVRCDFDVWFSERSLYAQDEDGTFQVQRAFDAMMAGRTSFIVAHRLSTIREADIILVMKDGQIIEQGRHEELLRKGGFYFELYNSQFAH